MKKEQIQDEIKQQAESQQPPLEVTPPKEAVIYCGPNLRGIVKQYAIFDGELPGQLLEEIVNNPLISKMIIPVTKLKETIKAINEKGSNQNILYNKLLEDGRSE